MVFKASLFAFSFVLLFYIKLSRFEYELAGKTETFRINHTIYKYNSTLTIPIKISAWTTDGNK